MDTRTGDIFDKTTEAEIGVLTYRKQMKLRPTVKQLLRKPSHPDAIGRVGRNEPCPCGSGIKFKKYCLTNK